LKLDFTDAQQVAEKKIKVYQNLFKQQNVPFFWVGNVLGMSTVRMVYLLRVDPWVDLNMCCTQARHALNLTIRYLNTGDKEILK